MRDRSERTYRTRLPGHWFRLEARLPPDLEDLALGIISNCQSLGASSLPAGWGKMTLIAWFADGDRARDAARLLSDVEGVRADPDQIERIEDPGWLDSVAARAEPVRAGRFVVVESAREERTLSKEQQIVLTIPRSRAFGTGEHATTRLCLELLSGLDAAPAKALDLGTGSGILAIAAARAGAKDVLALDNDARVLDVTQENVAMNGVAPIVRVRRGSYGDIPRGEEFALIFGNIHRTTLVRAAARLVDHLTSDGVAILSGFVTEDADEVECAWREAGCLRGELVRAEEWIGLAMRKPPARSVELGDSRV